MGDALSMSEFFLSSSESAPMYSQIMEQILAKVLAGDWGPGHALPSIRELASASKVVVPEPSSSAPFQMRSSIAPSFTRPGDWP